MKKFIAVLMIIAIMITVISGCENGTEFESITVKTTKETTTLKNITEKISESGTFTEPATIEESTTERPIEYIKSGKIKIDNGKHQYTIEKKAFEDNYSEEFLMSLSRFYRMEFGFKDYDNWNGEANAVLNDLMINGGLWFDCFEYNSPEWIAATDEMRNNPHKTGYAEYGFTTVENINNQIKRLFGPSARAFEEDDFETYNEMNMRDDSVFEDYDSNYRFAYLPKSELIIMFTSEFIEGGMSTFLCDVKTVDGCYVVEAVRGSESFFKDGYTFEGQQKDALRMFNRYTYGRLFKSIFTIAVDDNNNMYMLSVDKSYIIPENARMNYRVNQDNVKVEVQKYHSSGWVVVDTLSEGEEVYSGTMYWLYEDYVWISTEKYEGRIEKKYLTPIE